MSSEMSVPAVNTDNSAIKSQLNVLGKYADPTGKIKQNLSADDKKDLAKAARGFEAIFINMMLKEMKQGMLEDEDKGDGGFGSDTLRGYMDMQLSDELSKQGPGIGIAQMIYSQLSGGEKLPTITTERASGAIDKLKNYIDSNLDSDKEQESSAVSESPYIANNFQDRVSDRLAKYKDIISKAAETYNVPESLIKGIIVTESAGKSDAKSAVGAKGLMQLMDSTAKSLGVSNSYDPEQNIMGGAKYISQMLEKFGSTEKALAAYNAGPGAVQKYDGIPPYKETQNYVQRVKKYSELYKA
jgi:Rod binding domain-containing protein